jgi:hypothetical protein
MRKWVAGLRSGEFSQGVGNLRLRLTDNVMAYCCLGIACEISMANGVRLVRSSTGGGYLDLDDPGVGQVYLNSVLPKSVREWLGTEHSDPVLSSDPQVDDITVTATHANDTLKWNFNKIADEIEKYYELSENNGEG